MLLKLGSGFHQLFFGTHFLRIPIDWKVLRVGGWGRVGVLQRKGLTCFRAVWWGWFTHRRRASCKPDFSQVGAKMLEAAVFGAYFNVMINLKDITDEKFKLVVSRSARAPPGGAAEGAKVAVTSGPSCPLGPRQDAWGCSGEGSSGLSSGKLRILSPHRCQRRSLGCWKRRSKARRSCWHSSTSGWPEKGSGECSGGSAVANTAGKYSCPCLGSVGICH